MYINITLAHAASKTKQQWRDHLVHLNVQEAEYHLTGLPGDIYPDFVMMAKSCGVPGSRIFRPEELRAAIRYCFSDTAMIHVSI